MRRLSLFFASLGGFLFGYQTGIIAGVLYFIALEFSLTRSQEGHLVSLLLMGAFFGAPLAGTLADRYGRKATIAFCALIFFASSLLAAFASSYAALLSFRFLTGIAIGIISFVSPLYIAEIAPPEKRGSFVTINQLAVTVGILVSYFTSYFFSANGRWRLMIGLGAIPAGIQLLCLRFASDTLKGEAPKESWTTFFSRVSKKLLFIGIFLNMFQQITGINAVVYYAPKIFLEAGYDGPTLALYASLGVALINVLATVVAVRFLDKVGRRPFLLIGSLGMALSLIFLSLAFFTEMRSLDLIAPLSLMMYIAFFAIGLGPIAAVYVSEIFPLNVRSKAMAIATLANWFFNYLVSLTFLYLVDSFGIGTTFSLYAILSLIAFYFSYLFIKETKGKALQ